MGARTRPRGLASCTCFKAALKLALVQGELFLPPPNVPSPLPSFHASVCSCPHTGVLSLVILAQQLHLGLLLSLGLEVHGFTPRSVVSLPRFPLEPELPELPSQRQEVGLCSELVPARPPILATQKAEAGRSPGHGNLLIPSLKRRIKTAGDIACRTLAKHERWGLIPVSPAQYQCSQR